jgi:diguanylate cyclase (GGDEF)-like protein
MDRTSPEIRAASGWRLRALAAAGLVAAVGWLASSVHRAEQDARRGVMERFRARIEMASSFLHAYADDLLARERQVAQSRLAGARPSQFGFDTVVEAFGFEAAVVIDEEGKLALVHPARKDIVGEDFASRYAHLRDALAQGSAISAVVPSAAKGAPVVAFATRYRIGSRWRVFSGAYDVSRTPLQGYLDNLTSLPGTVAELIDPAGIIVSSSRGARPAQTPLEQVDPLLASAVKHARMGSYAGTHGPRRFVAQPVEGTPWQLVVSADEAAIFTSVGSARQWLLFAALTLALLAATVLTVRLVEQRRALRVVNAELDRLARVDRLTNVPNRRHLEEQLAALLSASRRHRQPLSVMVIDVDHFKRINDEHGHAAGDQVLQGLAARMSEALRAEDIFGRWGGEEFLAFLPNTSAEGAALAAERVRVAVRNMAVTTEAAGYVCATVSIGCATTNDPTDQTLVARADVALYRAKELGRDRVVAGPAASDRRIKAVRS